MLVRARDVGRTVEAKFMLTRSAEAFAIGMIGTFITSEGESKMHFR